MTIFKLHSEPLKDEWLDAYGHLNEAYYSRAVYQIRPGFCRINSILESNILSRPAVRSIP